MGLGRWVYGDGKRPRCSGNRENSPRETHPSGGPVGGAARVRAAEERETSASGLLACGVRRIAGPGVGSGVRLDVGAPVGGCVTGAGVDRCVPRVHASIQPRVACDVCHIAGPTGGIEADKEGRPRDTRVKADIPRDEAIRRRAAKLEGHAPGLHVRARTYLADGPHCFGIAAANLAARAVRRLGAHKSVLARIESAIDTPIEGGRCIRTRIGSAVVGRRRRGAARRGRDEPGTCTARESYVRPPHGSTVALRSDRAPPRRTPDRRVVTFSPSALACKSPHGPKF
jgi:hypothetical protein